MERVNSVIKRVLGEMSKDARSRVSAQISHLVKNEGKPQQQAVAMALDMKRRGDPPIMYHGTSSVGLNKIRAGSITPSPVYRESNISMGGAYLTRHRQQAALAAQRAARTHGGDPVVVKVRPHGPLHPDEDWVVSASENDCSSCGGEGHTGAHKRFFDDLFSGYQGEGHSLSDHYKDQFHLNDEHGITWQDSYDQIGSVRQEKPLHRSQLVGTENLLTKNESLVMALPTATEKLSPEPRKKARILRLVKSTVENTTDSIRPTAHSHGEHNTGPGKSTTVSNNAKVTKHQQVGRKKTTTWNTYSSKSSHPSTTREG